MIQRSVEFRSDDSFSTHHKWVPYQKISPEMARAVIASEDNLFEKHDEVYLNVIETGKGLYGVEAAAEHCFKTTAAELSRRQSCLIAACLPNPLKRNAGNPSSYVSSRAGQIAALEPKLSYPDWIYHKDAKGGK